MNNRMLSKIITELTAVLVKSLWLGRIDGISKIPTHPCIIIANHESYLDFLLIGYSLNRKAKIPFIFWAKSKVLRHSLWKIYSGIFGTIEVGDHGGIDKLLETSKQAMQNGNYICIFPEGTRSRTGDLQYFKQGYLRLATDTGKEIVPVFLENTYHAWPSTSRLPKRRKCNITFLSSIQISKNMKKSEIDTINQTIMKTYRELKKHQDRSRIGIFV
jgi:1-acyl-sn-glycerol-3-phosphate acyltransferase